MPKVALKEKPMTDIWPFASKSEADAFNAAMPEPKRHSVGFKIEKDVPLPESKRGRGQGAPKYPFADMAAGDSFFVPMIDGSVKKTRGNISSATRHWGKARGAQFATREVKGGIRVWRIV